MLGIRRVTVASVLLLCLLAACNSNHSQQKAELHSDQPAAHSAGSATTPSLADPRPARNRNAPPHPAGTAKPQPSTPLSVAQNCPTPAESVITSAPGTGKTVALTFDDGAGPDSVAIAEILRAKGVPATFFDTGANDSFNQDAVKKIAAMGFLVENHSWDHDYPSQAASGWTVDYLRDQIARTSDLQQRLTGRRVCFFRPPGGYLTDVLTAAADEGLSTVKWSVDSEDWTQPGQDDPDAVAGIVRRATTLDSDNDEHPIILMHAAKASHEPESDVSSYRGNTIKALPQIIDWYTAHGFRFVDLLGETAPRPSDNR